MDNTTLTHNPNGPYQHLFHPHLLARARGWSPTEAAAPMKTDTDPGPPAPRGGDEMAPLPARCAVEGEVVEVAGVVEG